MDTPRYVTLGTPPERPSLLALFGTKPGVRNQEETEGSFQQVTCGKPRLTQDSCQVDLHSRSRRVVRTHSPIFGFERQKLTLAAIRENSTNRNFNDFH